MGHVPGADLPAEANRSQTFFLRQRELLMDHIAARPQCRRDMFIVNQGSTAKDESRYNSLIISIITYSSASWTLTKANKKRLDAFNTKALRRIVGVRWYDYVTNASMLSRTGQPPLTTTIRKLRLGAFEHIFFICPLHPGVTVCACNTVRLPGTGQSAHVIGGSRFTRPASNSRRTLLNWDCWPQFNKTQIFAPTSNL